ncbi:MAG: tRNA pseudouridine synthase [Bacteroidetes bacterium]|jgi:tRNA pseudouridine38-40 synthase|nr:tRNA pseudouridine synthase [Bacteroidota bacterium]
MRRHGVVPYEAFRENAQVVRTLKLIIEYDGTDFVGWQSQVNGRAVQDEIEKVLRQVLNEEVRITGAGRTDAGVHARGQVAGLQTHSLLPPEKLHAALNGLLPHDICVHKVEEAAASFHARFDAIEREYSYTIRFIPSALDRRISWHVKYALSSDLLHAVAAEVMGKHDFTSFCKQEHEVENRVCTVIRSEWTACVGGMVYHIAADRFVHGMVRSLVGTMVDIARGYFPPDAFREILDKRDRRAGGTAAPAVGLILEKVTYR